MDAFLTVSRGSLKVQKCAGLSVRNVATIKSTQDHEALGKARAFLASVNVIQSSSSCDFPAQYGMSGETLDAIFNALGLHW